MTFHRFSTYLELTKPRLTSLALFTSSLGFLLAGFGSSLDGVRLIATVFGTALVGGGAAALNQYLERNQDARMSRTRHRPIPSGRVEPQMALRFGIVLCAAGLLTLTLGATPLAGILAAVTLASYLLIYTPLKTRTALCTLVGAIPGALPPLIGWAAASGDLSAEAWFLFGILFLWQLPHFLAIAWVHLEDYRAAGFQMLPVLDQAGGATSRQIVLYSLALIPVSLLPAVFGSAGMLYFFGALASSVALFGVGLATATSRSQRAAHRLFLASILYLPVILTTLTLERLLT